MHTSDTGWLSPADGYREGVIQLHWSLGGNSKSQDPIGLMYSELFQVVCGRRSLSVEPSFLKGQTEIRQAGQPAELLPHLCILSF